MNKLLFFSLTLCNIVIIIVFDNIMYLFEWSFYFYLFFLAYDIIKIKDIHLIHIWVFSFLYIIVSEGLLRSQELETLGNLGLEASKFLLIANNLVLSGYFLFNDKKIFKNYTISFPRKSSTIIILTSILIYTFYNFNTAVTAFLYGRVFLWASTETNLLLDTLFDPLALILPSIIVYYFNIVRGRKTFFLPLILSLPIFGILFMNGSRFPLLFSFLGFILTLKNSYDHIKKRDLIVLFIMPVLLFLASNVMMQFRDSGGLESDPIRINMFQANTSEHVSLAQTMANFMSPEGIINQNANMIDYFKSNNHLYGVSTGFIFYFWVPRSIWPNKPTQLGYWLIRARGETGFGDMYSVGYGFSGDFYADFGYFGALLASFLLGIGLKRLETYNLHLRNSKQYSSVLIAMLYPYVFFAVRDAITASHTFLLIIIIYALYGFVFKKRKYDIKML